MARIPIYESQVGRPVPNMPLRAYDTRNVFAGAADALAAGAQVADKITLRFQAEEDNRTEMNLRLKAMQDFDTFSRSLEGRNDRCAPRGCAKTCRNPAWLSGASSFPCGYLLPPGIGA